MQLSSRIQDLRKSNYLSQERFAAKMGVTRQAVSKWELGHSIPDIEKIISMSNLFGVTTDYLLKGETQVVEEAEPAKEEKKGFSLNKKVTGFILLVISVITAAILPLLAKFMQYKDMELYKEAYRSSLSYLTKAPLIFLLILTIFLAGLGVYFVFEGRSWKES